MKSVKYLDDLICVRRLKNDAEPCRHMEWSHGAVYSYRNGIRFMDNEKCLQVVREFGIENPLPIIVAVDLDRAERVGRWSLWEVFSPRMTYGGLIAPLVSIGLGVINFVTPSPAEVALLSHSSATNTLCYVK